MKPAYNPQWLKAKAIIDVAEKWRNQNFITSEQYSTIESKYQDHFFTPNIFVRIGLFLFTTFLAMCGFGLFAITAQDIIGGWCLFYSAIIFFILEYFIREKHHYRSGIDDALLYSGLAFFIAGCLLIIDPRDYNLTGSVIALILFSIAAVRYLDVLVTLCAYGSLLNIIALLAFKGPAQLFLPFIFMAVSALVYFSVKKRIKDETLFPYHNSLHILRITSLLSFYFAGNYFVIKEGNKILSNQDNVPFAWIFLVFTFLVPLIYIIYALKKKDRAILTVGLIITVQAVLTFKYYFSLAPPEISLTAAGVVITILAWLSIKALKKPKYGLTFKTGDDEQDELLNMEALLAAQSFGKNPAVPQETGVEFGGGKFGGGGAGGNF